LIRAARRSALLLLVTLLKRRGSGENLGRHIIDFFQKKPLLFSLIACRSMLTWLSDRMLGLIWPSTFPGLTALPPSSDRWIRGTDGLDLPRTLAAFALRASHVQLGRQALFSPALPRPPLLTRIAASPSSRRRHTVAASLPSKAAAPAPAFGLPPVDPATWSLGSEGASRWIRPPSAALLLRTSIAPLPLSAPLSARSGSGAAGFGRRRR
jgi:hypothetical protein